MALTKEQLLAKIKAAKEKRINSESAEPERPIENSNEETKAQENKEPPAQISKDPVILSIDSDSSSSKNVVSRTNSMVQTEGIDPIYEPFKMKLAELEQALENQVPGFAFLLRDIHQTMKADPNVVTILTEDEIGLVVRGLEKNLNLTIVPSKSTGKSSAKRTQPLSAEDL